MAKIQNDNEEQQGDGVNTILKVVVICFVVIAYVYLFIVTVGIEQFF